jgi:hypothetical protein
MHQDVILKGTQFLSTNVLFRYGLEINFYRSFEFTGKKANNTKFTDNYQ